MAENISEEQRRIEFAKRLKDILTTIDLEKIRTRNVNTYNRDSLRTYLRNPAAESNNKNLRKLSNYLYTISHIYRRMIQFKANQINLKAWTAYPLISMVEEENDEEKILQEYDRITTIVNNMHMDTQILKLMLQAWKNGVVYGYCYGDPEKNGTFYIHPLDPDYCRICGMSIDHGVYQIAYDMSYFVTYPEQLEFYDKNFQKLYREYENDNLKWKVLPIEKTFCIKIDPDNWEYSIPPLSALFESIISLCDIQGAQDEIDELSNYKMIWGKLDTIKGTNIPDDYETSLDLALGFMDKIKQSAPNTVGVALSPMDLGTIEFNNDQASDTNTLSKAYTNLVEANGAIILNSNRITSSKAFMMALKSECEDAMAPVRAINAWINFYLKQNCNNENIYVEFSDVSPYFVDDEVEKLTKLAGLSLPVKNQLASLVDANVRKSTGMDYLERRLQKLGTDAWINPLVSANTVSAEERAGAPTKSDTELTDEGEASRDKDTTSQQ